MKPRHSSTLKRIESQRLEANPRPYRSSAEELTSSALNRGEAALYFVLAGSVLMAFFQQAESAHRFVAQLPEFASAMADLVRNLV